MKKKHYFVSIVIATCNSSRTLPLCLDAVRKQRYPKELIEIIVADGGSSDGTRFIAKKYGARIYSVDPKRQNAEYNKGVGFAQVKGEIVLFLDHDNIMPHDHWLADLLEPFNDNPEIIGVEPSKFYYDPKMTLLDRYVALTGGSDPVVYYLGKNSHLSWVSNKYNLLGKAKDRGKYYEVTFTHEKLPALGGNGAALRTAVIRKFAEFDPAHFVHTDIVYDIVKSGRGTYAFIKDSIIHLTNNRVIPFLLRRKHFIEQYQFTDKHIRRYALYDPKVDTGKLVYFAFISLTWIIPFIDALRGYRKMKDPAWFLHPLLCFVYTLLYGWAVIAKRLAI